MMRANFPKKKKCKSCSIIKPLAQAIVKHKNHNLSRKRTPFWDNSWLLDDPRLFGRINTESGWQQIVMTNRIYLCSTEFNPFIHLYCNSLKCVSVCLYHICKLSKKHLSINSKEIPCVYKVKPSGVLVASDNQNIHQLLHRLTLKQTITNLRYLYCREKLPLGESNNFEIPIYFFYFFKKPLMKNSWNRLLIAISKSNLVLKLKVIYFLMHITSI